MELFEYQNRLLQEDGLVAKDNCEKVLSEIATKYKMSDADYENLQKAIIGFVQVAMDNTYSTMLAEGVEIGREKAMYDMEEVMETQLATDLLKMMHGIRL